LLDGAVDDTALVMVAVCAEEKGDGVHGLFLRVETIKKLGCVVAQAEGKENEQDDDATRGFIPYECAQYVDAQ
jgi:hypothetical protein